MEELQPVAAAKRVVDARDGASVNDQITEGTDNAQTTHGGTETSNGTESGIRTETCDGKTTNVGTDTQSIPKIHLAFASTEWRRLQHKNSDTDLDNFYSLLDAIAAFDYDQIESFSKKIGRRLQYITDLQGLDAFHHVIINRNMTAMHLLMDRRGLFRPPHEPKANHYLHLAAKVGFVRAIPKLLQDRPADYHRKSRLEIPYCHLHKDKPADFQLCRIKQNHPPFTSSTSTDEEEASMDMSRLAIRQIALLKAKPKDSANDTAHSDGRVENEKVITDASGKTATVGVPCDEQKPSDKKSILDQLEDSGFSELTLKHESVDSDQQIKRQTIDEKPKCKTELTPDPMTAETSSASAESSVDTNEPLTTTTGVSASDRRKEEEHRRNEEFMHQICMEDPDVIEVTEPLVPLEHAVTSGQIEVVEALLETPPHQRRQSHLESAVNIDSSAALELLLKRPNPLKKLEGINDALKAAIRRRKANMIEILIQNGADHNKAFDGMNCLHCLYSYTWGFASYSREPAAFWRLSSTTETSLSPTLTFTTAAAAAAYFRVITLIVHLFIWTPSRCCWQKVLIQTLMKKGSSGFKETRLRSLSDAPYTRQH